MSKIMENGSGSRSKEEAFTLHHYTKTIFKKAEVFNKQFPLHPYFDELIDGKKKVSILDVGAGMFSTTGSTREGVEVKITNCDVLADEYMDIMKRFGVIALFPVDQQDMENLTYPDESFDIVHCANAIDHAENPFKAIQEMYRVCKKGGYIYLRHYFNTAMTQKYRGMHQWNIHITVNNDCVFYGPKGGFALSELYQGFKNESRKEPAEEKCHQVVSILRKK